MEAKAVDPSKVERPLCKIQGTRWCCQVREIGEFHWGVPYPDRYTEGIAKTTEDIHKSGMVGWCVTNLAQEKAFMENKKVSLQKTLTEAGWRPVYCWKSPNTQNMDTLWLRGLDVDGVDEGFKMALAMRKEIKAAAKKVQREVVPAAGV